MLTKPTEGSVNDTIKDEAILMRDKKLVYLLPLVNVDCYIKNGLFESWLIEWSKQLCDKTKIFLDVGAHTGTYALSLAGECERVMAFEPQKHTYYALCGSVALSGLANVECVQVALGSPEQAAEGAQALQVCSLDGGGSSLCLAENMRERKFREELVQVRTLDSYLLENIGFVKLDVEGNELNVLRGAKETLIRSGRPKILFESNEGVDEELFEYIKSDWGLGYRAIVQIRGVGNMFLAEI
jgi:FkbM family methyltransferase